MNNTPQNDPADALRTVAQELDEIAKKLSTELEPEPVAEPTPEPAPEPKPEPVPDQIPAPRAPQEPPTAHVHDTGNANAINPLISRAERIRVEIDAARRLPLEQVPVIELVDNLIAYAYFLSASDIHFDPDETKLIVRIRVDGIQHDVFELPKNLQPTIISRIKVLSSMRTDEHQSAQDGRFKTSIPDMPQQFDIRVSVVPTYYGEDAVARLLVEHTPITSLDDLNFSDSDKAKVERAIQKPNGMILATGPTGSGKTTTLYTVLLTLKTPDVSIITIEDPVEYSIHGINQIQVNADTGLTFADGLRSILRQDPDIIMVGEIRDKETAAIAVNAALTGHLLLSTLHTNDAATTLPRLLDMGVEPFLIASTVNIAIGQRLVRKLCQTCKVPRSITEAEFARLSTVLPDHLVAKDSQFFASKGCAECGNTGFASRVAIHEVLEMNDEIRDAVMKRINASEIRKLAMSKGMTTMLEDGFQKVLLGLTTIEEVLRVVQE
ncbi:MAG: GspE/PulE family protein [Patescibacteria group bacterium]